MFLIIRNKITESVKFDKKKAAANKRFGEIGGVKL
jgi:hypothetical protein